MVDAALDALKGVNKFKGSPVPVRTLMVLYPNRMHVVSVEGRGIEKMSDLKGNMLADSHLVYVGLMSGLGILGDPALAASRLSLGGSYDELIDIQSNATYVSTAGDSAEGRYVDYGFISTFPGPGRNRVVVISGTRDTGVMMAAEAATSAATLKDLATQAGNAPSFETLFEIQGVARSGMKSKMLFVAPVEAQGIWEMP